MANRMKGIFSNNDEDKTFHQKLANAEKSLLMAMKICEKANKNNYGAKKTLRIIQNLLRSIKSMGSISLISSDPDLQDSSKIQKRRKERRKPDISIYQRLRSLE